MYCQDCDENESSGDTCKRCGRFICDDCTNQLSLCGDCVTEDDVLQADEDWAMALLGSAQG